MKKMQNKTEDNDIKMEYDFDYSKAKQNRFANIIREKTIFVPLEEDVAKVFNTASEVNDALRAIIKAIPPRISRKRKSLAYNKK